MELLSGIKSTGDALNAEKTRIDLIAQNIANANTTRTEEGGPYRRQLAVFESYLPGGSGTGAASEMNKSVQVSGIVEDKAPGKFIYNPSHPHANAEGMVEMPNVQVSREMVDLISATRAYEANLSVVRTSRQMATQALNIGR